MLAVDEILLDVVPASECFLQGILVVEVLVEVEPSHYILCLHPPMEVVVDVTRVEVRLVNHRTVGIQAFLRCLRHFLHDGLHLL